MAIKLKSITLITSLTIIILSNSSCKRKGILLDVKFGIPSSSISKNVNQLVKNGDVKMEVVDSDTLYHTYLNIDDSAYRANISFNDDNLKTGNLRCYKYDLATYPFTLDSVLKSPDGKYKSWDFHVLKFSDFERVKLYLDKAYGAGIHSSKVGWRQESHDTIYKYTTPEVDIFLRHGDHLFWPSRRNLPFYSVADITFKSKSYGNDYSIEKRERRKYLRPSDVLEIDFYPPFLDSSHVGPVAYGLPSLIVCADVEKYSSPVVDEEIVECKGVLTITNAYDEELTSLNILYKFRKPIAENHVMKGQNCYFINADNNAYNKIKELVDLGYALKSKFRPTAVALKDGSTIR